MQIKTLGRKNNMYTTFSFISKKLYKMYNKYILYIITQKYDLVHQEKSHWPHLAIDNLTCVSPKFKCAARITYPTNFKNNVKCKIAH